MPREHTRVLVVDDDPDIRTLVNVMLTLAGYGVVAESRDGAEAVRHVEALEPDIVVLDVQMPHLSGDLAAVKIREISSRVRILAFSAHLDANPGWADAWLPKSRVELLPQLLDELSGTV